MCVCVCLCLTCRVLLALAGDVKNRGTIVQQGGAKVRVCDLGICAREGGGGEVETCMCSLLWALCSVVLPVAVKLILMPADIK